MFEPGETQICNWVMGIKEADTVLFDTGAVRRVYHFRNGALHGLEQHFDKSGRIENQRRWVDGILQGPYKEREALFHNEAGELLLTLERGRYKDGEKAGPYVDEGYRSDLFKFQGTICLWGYGQEGFTNRRPDHRPTARNMLQQWLKNFI